MQIDSGMNLYEACQAERRVAPPLDAIMANKELTQIEKWASQHTYGEYFMLLCNELKYYTVFHIKTNDWSKFRTELRECIRDRGELIEIAPADEEYSAYEIWIRDKEDDEPHVFMLFEYSWGVIEVGED